jgi:hypothetical protein
MLRRSIWGRIRHVVPEVGVFVEDDSITIFIGSVGAAAD